MSIFAKHLVKIKEVFTIALTPTQVKLFEHGALWNHIDQHFKCGVSKISMY